MTSPRRVQAPSGGWQVLVQDQDEDPAQQISLVAGKALATSSTQKRRWEHNGVSVHHILDPRFGLPADDIWRSVSVAADSCLEANAYSTAGVVRGFTAIQWFRDLGIAGRFVDRQGRVVLTGMWPQDIGDRERAAGVNVNG
ncbi:FAD:protein FMN transferase [Arthrobacter psychrolactophilus]